ncbi:class I SAM-dependent methyltransferase [Phenylobacterium sp.]|uniref:class I SAM-dependent methyltransferase n=1 Tax=Phenylobacterium sp. TaxID=1871053 RepID=UPI0025D55D6C|nr:class I SAM-dependent methyltransferase [Phenylobacterium sp.]MCA3586093.1 class I SAM-dependent methyltransferase [Methylocystis sp.]MCA6346413.1 class I SAM-dependent methyltransferase [Phenylobacterium sp.]MCA6355397.1 class I SAM-dependent methyltransferase [Phenylobacterium sp.]MCA6361387.1 class I SAM-dependent methyltransferase [Phenylobacterium sp.]
MADGVGASRQAIEYHYDLGREFYGLWLDPSLTYSAAMFAPDLGLEAAQARKIDFHLDNVDITRCARLLDVGCGWGGGADPRRRTAAWIEGDRPYAEP